MTVGSVSPGHVLRGVGDSRDDAQCARDSTTHLDLLPGGEGDAGEGIVARGLLGAAARTETACVPGKALPAWLLSLATRLDPLVRGDTAEREPGLEDGVLSLLSGEDLIGRVAVPHASHGHRSSLREVFATLRAYVGPGLLIAVGYMDPGNWSTNLAGGSAFGYDLLCVIVFANVVGACFQHLAVRLGVATSLDLAQACRARYHPAVNRALWLVCEISILATDLAEVLGSAIAFRILLGIPLAAGVVINVADVLIFLLLQGQRARVVESLILCLILLIIACLVFALVKTRAPALSVVSGLVPRARIVTNSAELYAAIGILGATVMPHNLFLHSSIILSRTFDKDVDGRRQAVTYGTIDSTVSLVGATFINAAILIVAAGVFAGKIGAVADLGQAAELLRPALGGAASTLFGVALLASGQQSTLTCTLAGQVVLEGFLAPAVSLKPWARRLATRLVAIVPALVVAASSGAGGVTRLLNLSQVILSLALPFAMFPLVHFCSTRQLMGELVAPRTLQAVAWLLWAGISALNVKLVIDFASGDGT